MSQSTNITKSNEFHFRSLFTGGGAYFGSEGFRQAIRVSVAMVVAYYISLSMGWDRPQWAGLAVALCSLSTTGDTAVKGLLRILGTFLAGAVAIFLAAVFPQERWAYLLVGSLYIALCAYMMGSTSRWYFWFISGYVMALLAMAGGPEGGTLFETIVLRVQQTTMGFVVFFAVASMLWPQKAVPILNKSVGDLLSAQQRLITLYGNRIAKGDSEAANEEEAELRKRVSHMQSELGKILDGAELDDLDVWFNRAQWRAFVVDCKRLNDSLENFRIGVKDLETLPSGVVPAGLTAAVHEIDRRFIQIKRMARGEKPGHQPRQILQLVDGTQLEQLSHFDRSVLIGASDTLEQIDRITEQLFGRMAELRRIENTVRLDRKKVTRPQKALDPDRIVAALRAFLAVWSILLLCIYVPDVPMPPGVVPMLTAVAIQMAITPFMPLSIVIAPGLGAVALAWVFHIFVMPHLHSYIGLGFGIFIVIFACMALMAKPQYGMARPIVTSFFVMVILVNNEQGYNPLFAINYSIAFMMALAVMWLTGLYPVSHQPQQALMWRLRRFFASASRVLQATQVPGEKHLSRHVLRSNLKELQTLPGKMAPWVNRQPAVTEKRMSPTHLTDLLQSCDLLSTRLHHLQDERARLQADALRKELREDFKAWRDTISEVMDELRDISVAAIPENLRSQHEQKLARTEERIAETLSKMPPDAISDEESQNMYRLMAAYRGVSEATVLVCEKASAINWDEIMENRF